MSDSSWPHGLQPTRLLRPWDSPGMSTGVGCCRLLQPNLTGFQSQIPWGVSLPDSLVGKSVVGPRTFLTVQEFLWYNCYAVLGMSAWQLYDGVNGDLQEGLYHRLCDQVAAPRTPAPTAEHCWTIPLQQTQTQVWLSLCSVSGSWCTQGFVWALWASLEGMGFDSECDSAPPTIFLGLLLCFGCRLSFFDGIQHSPVNSCSAVSCYFGVLTGEDECMSFYSVILLWMIDDGM